MKIINKIINKINPRISAFKFKDEVRGFLKITS